MGVDRNRRIDSKREIYNVCCQSKYNKQSSRTCRIDAVCFDSKNHNRYITHFMDTY